ncbi:MAG: ATP-dependent DNA helicase [Rhodospirillales bacterium]|nr:ATP-dependent DNA helicase [Rhodospirillales bacterium]
MSLEAAGGWRTAPTMVAGAAGTVWLTPDGEPEEIDRAEARRRWETGPAPLICHAATMRRRTGTRSAPAFDILELVAFVRPARFVVPTPRGLAQALDLADPHDLTDQTIALRHAASLLLDELRRQEPIPQNRAGRIAVAMINGGWLWGGDVADALALDASVRPSLDVWSKLDEWSETAPRTPAGHRPVSGDEVHERLTTLLGDDAEQRPQQAEYAMALSPGFAPRQQVGEPEAVIAEAGTGVGKTLGYVAPASVWAEKNKGTVWISTYTRNLQRQVDQELDRLVPDPAAKRRRIVIRKGRENYICLLNLAEASQVITGRPNEAIPLGLVARWVSATRDGDMTGGDFPGWLVELLGNARTLGLADQRGECVYSACPHYQTCFIERSIRRARQADLVVANHALVLIQASLAGDEDPNLPTRYVFDEGHHLFDASDSVFSAELTGREGEDLRRWLLGAEGRRSRARGLARRIGDLIGDEGEEPLEQVLKAARCLPAEGWRQRIADDRPRGPTEGFLALVRQQVLARNNENDLGYSLECPTAPLIDGIAEAASLLHDALGELHRPLAALARHLATELDDKADELDTATRLRLDAMIRGIDRRGLTVVRAWRQMLEQLQFETPDAFVDWFSLDRVAGREIDVGMHRHWVDPGLPFAENVVAKAHGAIITSATLRDAMPFPPDNPDADNPDADSRDGWQAANLRTGMRHLARPPTEAAVASPFAYPELTRLLIVTDVSRNDPAQVAAAFRELFLASGGGALGLFTAIARLRDVHGRVAEALEHAGLPLYAQHVDAMDTGTLVDIFRAEEDACLLGTDAMRDGVDVPGRSLRLIVFDRVPWPRPDLLHKARREAFGGSCWDDLITRLRLRQAFGRLVRRADDRGVFVLLDHALPSRLLTAFPEGLEARRLGLADTIAEIHDHLRS